MLAQVALGEIQPLRCRGFFALMKDQADVNDLRSNRLAKIEKVLLGRVSEEERTLQATADGNGVLLSLMKKSFPVRIREAEIDPQMVQAKTRQTLSIERRVGNMPSRPRTSRSLGLVSSSNQLR